MSHPLRENMRFELDDSEQTGRSKPPRMSAKVHDHGCELVVNYCQWKTPGGMSNFSAFTAHDLPNRHGQGSRSMLGSLDRKSSPRLTGDQLVIIRHLTG